MFIARLIYFYCHDRYGVSVCPRWSVWFKSVVVLWPGAKFEAEQNCRLAGEYSSIQAIVRQHELQNEFQMCHFGSPAEDLGRLLVASVSAETRLKNWEQILEFYHTEFHKNFDKEFFSVEQVRGSDFVQQSSTTCFLLGSYVVVYFSNQT